MNEKHQIPSTVGSKSFFPSMYQQDAFPSGKASGISLAIDKGSGAMYTHLEVAEIANAAAEAALKKATEQMLLPASGHLENGTGQRNDSPVAEALTIDELAALLQISRPTAYELTRREGFPCFHIGKSIRVGRKQLEDWIAQQCQQQKGVLH